MNIIILSKNGQDAKNISLSGIFVFIFLLIFSISLSFFLYNWFFSQHQNPNNQAVIEFINQQKFLIHSLERDIQTQKDNTILKLAKIKNKLISLDNLSTKLMKQANFKTSDFNFKHLDMAIELNKDREFISKLSKDYTLVNKENNLDQQLSLLLLELNDKLQQLDVIAALYNDERYVKQVTPRGKPAERGWVSSYYGKRKDPFSGKSSFHKGIDVAAKADSNIIATATGIVSWSGKRSGYGNLVELTHGNGLVTRYGHCKSLLVKIGDKVSQGDAIATIGSTGRSTGPHVHYEVIKNNVKINPIRYVRKRRSS